MQVLRSGKICNGPKSNKQNTSQTQHSRSGIGPKRSTTVRQEAVKIQAQRSTRGPESVRKDLQRSDKKQSKYKLNAAIAVRNRSGIGQKDLPWSEKKDSKYKLNAAFAVRNRLPLRKTQITTTNDRMSTNAYNESSHSIKSNSLHFDFIQY